MGPGPLESEELQEHFIDCCVHKYFLSFVLTLPPLNASVLSILLDQCEQNHGGVCEGGGECSISLRNTCRSWTWFLGWRRTRCKELSFTA